MKNISLKKIYLIVLTIVFSISFIVFLLLDSYVQENQSKEMLAEEARVFAEEMDAVWRFMDFAQPRINYTEDGGFEFKGLHCSIVGKSVGTLFSVGNDYKIRYTNFNPRSIQDLPDEFEAQALEVLEEDRSSKEYYDVAEFEGEENFRYVQALEVDASCLECHGEPAGEIDITGYAKEGWTMDSIGGAISIVIPLDQQKAAMVGNITRDAMWFLLFALMIGIVVYVMTSVLILRPLEEMRGAFDEMKEGRLQVSLKEDQGAKEIGNLVSNFNSMAEELKNVQESLEIQVEDRTTELQSANNMLVLQRDDLERLNTELEHKTQFKDDLLSMVNHELRTPLTSIVTFSQISREASKNETDRRSWEEIEKNSQVLLIMINNMLDIARSDAGSVSASIEEMDLGDIVSAVKSTIAPLATRSGVSFKTSVAPDVPLVFGDYEKTVRMLENLASNALKFTEEDGHIALTIRRETGSGEIRIMIEDDGIGIAEKDRERIFERFVQVDSTSTRKYSGSGLGLSLVKEYADLQGYSIFVESEVGKGSRFTVVIPKSAIVEDIDV